ncbi:MAG: P-II family nitrogen regulator [Verrucomicrobiales bacterium]
MKKVEAIIKPFKLEEVREVLAEAGIEGMTVTDVKGFGRQRGHKEVYRGSEYAADMLPKIKIEILIEDQEALRVASLIVEAGRTGKIGDGKVFILPIDEVRRIRTGERGSAAL